MVAWMNAETLRMTLAEGRTVFWSRSRQEVWRKGDTSGDRQYVREARYDCDGDVLLFVVEQEGKGACHTGEHSCFFRAFGAVTEPSSGRVPGARPRPHRRAGVARGARRPHDPGRRRSCASSATGPASCSSRSSTSAGAAGASSAATRWPRSSPGAAHARRSTARCRRRSRPTRASSPPSRRCCAQLPVAAPARPAAAARRARRLPRLRRRPRGRAPARRPARRPRQPRRRPLGHRRARRLRPLAPAGHARRQRLRARRRRRRRRRRRLRRRLRRLDALAAAGASAARRAARRAARPRRPAARRRSSMGARRRSWRAVEVAKEHILAGDIFQVVLAQRFDLDLGADPFDVYRVLRQVNPSPYMYFLRQPRGDASSARRPSRWCSCSTAGSSAGRSPAPATAAATDEDDRRLGAELIEHPKEIAEHVMLVDLARNDVGRVVALRHRAGRRADDPRALQPRHAPDVAGVGRPARRPRPGRRAAGDAAGRHGVGRAEGAGDGDHRRPRAGRSGARTPASSATSTSPATSTPPSPSARWCASPTAGRRCRPAPASSPTAIPSTRTSSAATRRGPCSPPCPPPGA